MKKTLYLLAILALLVPTLTFASFDASLKYGSRGDAVSELQDFLTDQNVYTGKVDGKFGFGTLKAVKAFQEANNLSVDGYFGKASRTVAQGLLASDLKASDDAEQAETGSVSPAVVTMSGCTDTTGFSTSTGHPCDGSTPTPVSDVNTQSAISALTQQVQTLTQATQQIASNTTPIVPVVQTPVVVPAPTCTIAIDPKSPDPLNLQNIILDWTSTNATSGELQYANGVSGGIPLWKDFMDISSTVANGSVSNIGKSTFLQAVFKGAGGTVSCPVVAPDPSTIPNSVLSFNFQSSQSSIPSLQNIVAGSGNPDVQLAFNFSSARGYSGIDEMKFSVTDNTVHSMTVTTQQGTVTASPVNGIIDLKNLGILVPNNINNLPSTTGITLMVNYLPVTSTTQSTITLTHIKSEDQKGNITDQDVSIPTGTFTLISSQ